MERTPRPLQHVVDGPDHRFSTRSHTDSTGLVLPPRPPLARHPPGLIDRFHVLADSGGGRWSGADTLWRHVRINEVYTTFFF